MAAAEAAARAVVKAAEEHGVLLAELHEVIGLSAARSAMQAVSVEDPTLTISEIARCLSPDSMAQLKGETLRRTDRSDRITPNELKKIFRQIGLDLNDDAWPQVFQELERDSTGRISYTEFVDALERAEEECRQCGIAAAMAAGTTLGQSALQAGHGLREAADCAAGAALRAAAEFGMVPADAAALGGRAASKLASEQSLDRVQVADAAAEAAGIHAMRAAVEADLTLEQVADEAAIAASAAAEEAGSTAQHVAEVSARAAGVAAGELAAEAGNTAMKSAEIAAKAATKSAAASGLPPYQAVEPTATAAARSATRAALNGGHPYLIVAEITRQLNSQLVENLKEVHQNQPDRVAVGELKALCQDLFSQANIDIHEDTLRQVFEEMGVDPKEQVSFNSFFQAVEKSHGIFIEAGKAAASIAGRVMGQNAAVAGDDPEQAGEVAASAAQSAARSSGLSDEQTAEVAVTAAGHAAGSAAIAAGGAPEYVAYVAGQAAINAATTAGLNTQLLPQVIIPVFARAAGRAAAQRSANGRDSTKALEVAAKAASEAGEKLAFMTPEHLAEAAEAASNEASRVLASGPKPVPGRGGGKGAAGRGRGRGAAPGASPGRTGPPSARPKAPAAPAPKPAAKKAAAKPKPTPKAPAPKAAPKAPAAPAPRPKSRTASANNSARSAARPTDSRASMDSRKGSERGETPKAKSKSRASSRQGFNGLEQPKAEQPLPISDGPRTAEAEREAQRRELEQPSSRTTMSQTQPSLKAGHSANSPPEMRMFMEPIAPGQARSFPAFNGPSGRSLQVPASVQRFYTPYIVARPASATIPVAPASGNSITVAVTQMSPPTVFRSPSQPAISPSRTSLGAGAPAPTTLPATLPVSGNLQRATTGATNTPATTVRSTQASTAPAPVYAPVRSVTGSPYGTPGRYQPTPTVLVSPAATMRVIEAPAVPPGTMTAPPAPLPGPMPGVARFETNREVSRPSIVPAPWTVSEPITPGATLAAPATRTAPMPVPAAQAATAPVPMLAPMQSMQYPFMAYPPTYRPPMIVPTVTHCQ